MHKPRVIGLDHLILTVRDLDATIRFYEDVLGMRAERFEGANGNDRAALHFGDQRINLHLAGHEEPPLPAHPMPGAAAMCFISETPLKDWAPHLAAHGVHVEDGPAVRQDATGTTVSLTVRDPDGNLVEIAEPIPAR